MVIDWSTIVLGSATAALSTYAVMRMDRNRNSEIRTTAGEIEKAVIETKLARAIKDICELEERIFGAELKIAAIEARTHIV